MTLNEKQIKFLQEKLSIELVEMLIEEYNYDMQKALDVFYNSKTFERLSDSSTGLYYQSAGYVFDYLKEEMASIQGC